MNEAVKEAVKAYECGDVPVGAVIVQNNKIIAAAHNRREAENDAAAHALFPRPERSKGIGGSATAICTLRSSRA